MFLTPMCRFRAQQFECDCDHLLPKAIAPIELELGLVGSIKVFSSSDFFWKPTYWAILLIASPRLTNKKSKQNNLLHFLILFRKMIIYLIWKLRETIYVGNTFLFSSVHTPGLIEAFVNFRSSFWGVKTFQNVTNVARWDPWDHNSGIDLNQISE